MQSIPNWDVGPRYQLIKKIGKGAYGSVCEALDTVHNERVAIKSLKALFEDETEAKHMLREICILRTLNFPAIIKITDILIPANSSEFNAVYIIMEYAEADLKKLAKSNTFLDRNQVRFLMYQAVCGCRYMHSANILHRDLKPANMLINTNCSLKICDFGLSRSYKRLNQPFHSQVDNLSQMQLGSEEDVPLPEFQKKVKRVLTGHVVTRWYRTPEVILLEREYGKEMDIWSLGCVFAEMLGMMKGNASSPAERSPLFPGNSCFPLSPDLNASNTRSGYPCAGSDQLNMIFEVIGTPEPEDLEFISDPKAARYVQSFPFTPAKDLRDFFPGSNPEELDLLSKMLTFSPRKRLTLDEALMHPYFATIKNPSLEKLAETPVDFIFDSEHKVDMPTLRELFRREVLNYNRS